MNKAFSFFQHVIGLIRKQLERIAWSTEGDHSVDDLTSETWLIVDELHADPNAAPDPDDESLHAMIVARLQKEFGKFVNRKERFAVRIDRDDIDDDGDLLPNSIGARLTAPEASEPLIALEMREEAAAAARVISSRFSEAIAYLRIFERFDGDAMRVASYLAIGARTLNRRVARASYVEETQPSMFDGIEAIPVDFVPPPGRWNSPPLAQLYRGACVIAWPVQRQLFMRSCKLFFSRRWRGRSIDTADRFE
ncbi:hypothetical protein LGN04_30020 [Burkholderia multivorans]|uniref:Uncharacterized protein n=1 Tax=Burkholderia pseudomultivorans TaxID=1207504 RepID=A0A6P2HGE9_9BURK|nr:MULTISPECIES: hypothetical protein [Burkholderia cepacia complex]MBU9185012.1 hypothetical protein [Burkholderia multivorans]MBU9438706.1 hypothetical protein [Burkholderia multivorans]MBU9598368.1 hypothetical protein [Burkholderia multivorans]MBU9648329.1 hypothetical protein [Burkholderia multivorans]MCA8458128.1 hypothetical protein [Burkholderia multivorans]